MDRLKAQIWRFLPEEKKFLHKIYSKFIDDHANIWREAENLDLARLRYILFVIIKLFYEEHKHLNDISQFDQQEFNKAVRELISNPDAFLQKAQKAQIKAIDRLGVERWFNAFRKDMERINGIIERYESRNPAANEAIKSIEFFEKDFDDFKRSRLNPDIFYESLNPFGTIEKLHTFSSGVEHGRFCVLKFDNSGVSGALGETIKYSFLKNFFRQFFPKITFFDEMPQKEQVKSQRKSRVISTRVIDFNELRNRRAQGDKSYFPEIDHDDFSRIYGYSMIQMKPFDLVFPAKESVSKVRERIEEEIGFKGKLVVTSLSDTGQIQNLIKCADYFSDAKIIVVQGIGIHYGFVLYAFEKEVLFRGLGSRFVNWDIPPGHLRNLYGVGNYAFVHYNKNKLEPIACGMPAITTEEYRNPSKNPNFIIDKVLERYGFIRILQSPDARDVLVAMVTNELLRDINKEVSEDENRKGIPSLKQETQRILNAMMVSYERERSYMGRFFGAIKRR